MFTFTQIGFIVLTLLCLAFILRQLHQALSLVKWSSSKRKRVWLGTWIGLGGWLLFISAASFSGLFANFSTFPPRIIIVLIIPLVTILFLTFSRSLTSLLQVIPPQNLLYIQSFRVVVEILLWMLFVQELLPVQMTFEGRNWDILVGITAPIIAYFCFVKRMWHRSVVLVWNLAGLLLLANIVTIAILSMPTPFRVFTNEPSNTIVAQFPFVWLPGVLVPIAYAMHFFSLRQLLKAPQSVSPAEPAQPH